MWQYVLIAAAMVCACILCTVRARAKRRGYWLWILGAVLSGIGALVFLAICAVMLLPPKGV